MQWALLAARRSELPIVELSINSGVENPADHISSDSLAKALNSKGSAKTLTALDVTGPPERFPQPTAALDGFLEQLAWVPRLQLRRLDLSWSNAAGATAVSKLLAKAAVAADDDGDGDCSRLECPRLECLRLAGFARGYGTVLSDSIAKIAPHLIELNLASCVSIQEDEISKLLSACTKLTHLDLTAVRMTPATFRAWVIPALSPSLCKTLRTLHMGGHTGLPSSSFAHALISCERLTDIDFSASLLADNALSEAALAPGSHLAHLKTVKLSECSALTNDGIAELCRASGTSLTSLSLGGPFSPLGDAAASLIGMLCTAPLTHLELPCCRLDVSGLCSLARIGGQLSCLNLSGCGLLTEDALSQLLRRTGPGCGARLQTLLLRSCDKAVTDDLLAGFLPRAHGLRTLDVAYCTQLTDLTAVMLNASRTRALAELRRLDLTGCNRITRRGREKLKPREAARWEVRLDSSSDDESDEGVLIDESELVQRIRNMRLAAGAAAAVHEVGA